MKKVLSNINSKIKIWKLITIVSLVTITFGFTYAYFSADTAQADNEFKTAHVNIAVKQNTNDVYYEDNADSRSNVLQIANKNNLNDFYILNKDSVEYPTGDTYVRVRLVPICRDAQGNGTGIEVAVTLKGDDNWEKRSDGYWYYKSVLSPGSSTTEFDIDTSGVDIPAGYSLEVQILADGLQAHMDGFDYNSAWTFN